MGKNFKLKADEIKAIATGYGSCIASDMITIHGRKVGYMYRDDPSFDTDSGWVFMSGDESQDYIDDQNNLAIYDVNTIANYDPEIVSFLHSAIGSEFERNESGFLTEVIE